MHTRTPFRVADEDRAFAALRRHGFATLISAGDDGVPYASRRYVVPDAFHTGLARGVAGFEIAIDSVEAAFKLSQDKRRDDQDGAVAALASGDDTGREIARLMRQEMSGVGLLHIV